MQKFPTLFEEQNERFQAENIRKIHLPFFTY